MLLAIDILFGFVAGLLSFALIGGLISQQAAKVGQKARKRQIPLKKYPVMRTA